MYNMRVFRQLVHPKEIGEVFVTWMATVTAAQAARSRVRSEKVLQRQP